MATDPIHPPSPADRDKEAYDVLLRPGPPAKGKRPVPSVVSRARWRRRLILAISLWGLAMLLLKAVLYLRSQR